MTFFHSIQPRARTHWIMRVLVTLSPWILVVSAAALQVRRRYTRWILEIRDGGSGVVKPSGRPTSNGRHWPGI